METEKKSRRKQRKQVNKEETDIELAEVEKKEEVKVIDEGDNKTWTESEKSSPERLRRKKKSRKKELNKLKEEEEENEQVDYDNKENMKDEVPEKAEKETKGEKEAVDQLEIEKEVTVKKKRFSFKLPELNPLKIRKKKSDLEEKEKKDKVDEEKINNKEGKEEKEEKDASKEEEYEQLNEEERSEAENVIHELPSASSGEKREEFGKKLSAKEKLKQKLDKKKSSEREPAKLLRHLSTQSSRLEDRLKEEDSDAQTAFERHEIAMKNKREKQGKELTVKDGFDFFTATWDEDPEEEFKQESKKESSKSEKKSEDDIDDEEGYETANEDLDDGSNRKKLLSKDYIGSEYVWEVTEWQGPDIIPYNTRIENEKEVYFTPSPFPPMKEELEQMTVSKISAEDEGIFTGKYPTVQKSNINKMENR